MKLPYKGKGKGYTGLQSTIVKVLLIVIPATWLPTNACSSYFYSEPKWWSKTNKQTKTEEERIAKAKRFLANFENEEEMREWNWRPE